MNERSIFTTSSGSSRSMFRDEKPVPKSSSAILMPAAWRISSSCTTSLLVVGEHGFGNLDLDVVVRQHALVEHRQQRHGEAFGHELLGGGVDGHVSELTPDAVRGGDQVGGLVHLDAA